MLELSVLHVSYELDVIVSLVIYVSYIATVGYYTSEYLLFLKQTITELKQVMYQWNKDRCASLTMWISVLWQWEALFGPKSGFRSNLECHHFLGACSKTTLPLCANHKALSKQQASSSREEQDTCLLKPHLNQFMDKAMVPDKA